jgi:hypothetical protein
LEKEGILACLEYAARRESVTVSATRYRFRETCSQSDEMNNGIAKIRPDVTFYDSISGESSLDKTSGAAKELFPMLTRPA